MVVRAAVVVIGRRRWRMAVVIVVVGHRHRLNNRPVVLNHSGTAARQRQHGSEKECPEQLESKVGLNHLSFSPNSLGQF